MRGDRGFSNAVELILGAIERGINYIDNSDTYLCGKANSVLKEVFANTKKPYRVTLKSSYRIDKTADAVRMRAENSLKSMGIDRATFFIAWSIMNFSEFEAIMHKGSIYDGALKLKDEGFIDHICFSTHAPVPDIIKIMEAGVFEAVTISFSLLNSNIMLPVLEKAQELDMGVSVMNPLGGGVIPQNSEYFSFACGEGEDSTVQAAMRFVLAHRAVKIVLTGPSTIKELNENLDALTIKSSESDEERIRRVNLSLKGFGNFCTGCDYCSGCPQGIPISAIMQSRNTLLFKPVRMYNRDGEELQYNIQLFRKLVMNFSYIPDTPENPCLKCGQCERKCTQKLRIVEMLDDTYKRMEKVNFSILGHRERLKSLLYGKGYKKVGFYPASGYTAFILEQYRSFFGEPEFEIIYFDSNAAIWGKSVAGKIVHPPSEIPETGLNIILGANYIYEQEIFESIKHFADDGIEVLKLHKPDEFPWLFN
jgi:predicted aldo/keto reductase-like oxidoreductase